MTTTASNINSTLITLDNAFRVHNNWKNRLKEAAASGQPLDTATIKRDDCCELGMWLYADGKRLYGQKPEFVKLIEKHQDFHAVASIVATIINKKEVANAEAMLQGSSQFSSASTEVLMAIMQLKATVAQDAPGAAAPGPSA